MIKRARILYDSTLASYLEKTDSGYRFSYDPIYLSNPKAKPISLTLPISIILTLAASYFLSLMG